MAGVWEFPGGKCEPGETAEAALQRELHEELGIRAEGLQHLLNVPWDYPEHSIHLMAYRVAHWDRDPHPCDGQILRWQPPKIINPDTLAPVDRPVLSALLTATLPD